MDKSWSGFSVEDYQAACESVEIPEVKVTANGPQLFMGGYKVVRADYFPSREQLTMTIQNGKLRFNTACLKKFEDVEYVEFLLNTVTNTIAIRPCDRAMECHPLSASGRNLLRSARSDAGSVQDFRSHEPGRMRVNTGSGVINQDDQNS